MIDYDKLKTLHQLLREHYGEEYSHVVAMQWNGADKEPTYSVSGRNFSMQYNSLDNHIAWIREKMQPETKYKVGEKLWKVACEQEPYEVRIKSIIHPENGLRYIDVDDEYHYEHELYPTKAALIAAQIKYWASLGKDCHDEEPEYCNVSGVKLDINRHHEQVDINRYQSQIKREPEGTTGCEHRYLKTLSKSGMYFVDMCHKCLDEKPWVECQHHCDQSCVPNNRECKCSKCGEFYR